MAQRDKNGRFVKGNTLGPRFQKGQSGNPAGMPKTMKTLLKEMPQEAREQVCAVFWTAISQKDVKSIQAFLEMKAEELPECGFVLQLAARHLTGKNGWAVFMDICDRLFGKAKQTTEIEGGLNLTPPAIIIEGEEDDA